MSHPVSALDAVVAGGVASFYGLSLLLWWSRRVPRPPWPLSGGRRRRHRGFTLRRRRVLSVVSREETSTNDGTQAVAVSGSFSTRPGPRSAGAVIPLTRPRASRTTALTSCGGAPGGISRGADTTAAVDLPSLPYPFTGWMTAA